MDHPALGRLKRHLDQMQSDNLEEALDEIEADRVTGATTSVVNLQWWMRLPIAEQDEYRLRADRARIELVTDDALSSRCIEVRGVNEGPPLSTGAAGVGVLQQAEGDCGSKRRVSHTFPRRPSPP